MLDNFRRGAVGRTGSGLNNGQWLILKSIKAKVQRGGYGNREILLLEQFTLFWMDRERVMKSDGKKGKWFDYDIKVQKLLINRNNTLILQLKSRQKEPDLSVFDDWRAYFDELELRYKSKQAEIDLEGLKAFMQTDEAKAGLAKWRDLRH